MKYNELKEMTLKDWDGKPFSAIVVDNPEADIPDYDIERLNVGEDTYIVTGYNKDTWIDDADVCWNHVYPIEWNQKKVKESLKPNPKYRRMTNRELAMWLAKGNGQMLYASNIDLSIKGDANLTTNHMYDLGKDNEECNDRIRVRTWGVEGWKEPTVDLLRGK